MQVFSSPWSICPYILAICVFWGQNNLYIFKIIIGNDNVVVVGHRAGLLADGGGTQRVHDGRPQHGGGVLELLARGEPGR